MNIKKANLKWKYALTKLDTSKITGIAVHHMAHPVWGVKECHDFHQNSRGWNGQAYAYEVDKNGDVWEIRGYEHKNGGLIGKLNDTNVSIVFQGDFDLEQMDHIQFMSGVWMIAYLRDKLNIKTIAGHKHWQKTSCPGKNFPLDMMITEANKQFIQSRCQFSHPDGVWDVMDRHDYAQDLYRKWADSYKR